MSHEMKNRDLLKGRHVSRGEQSSNNGGKLKRSPNGRDLKCWELTHKGSKEEVYG